MTPEDQRCPAATGRPTPSKACAITGSEHRCSLERKHTTHVCACGHSEWMSGSPNRPDSSAPLWISVEQDTPTAAELEQLRTWHDEIDRGILHDDGYNARMIGIDERKRTYVARLFGVPAEMLGAPVDSAHIRAGHPDAYPPEQGWRRYHGSDVVICRSGPGPGYYLVRTHAPIDGAL